MTQACPVYISEISVTETITEMEIIDQTLTETETMAFVETEMITFKTYRNENVCKENEKTQIRTCSVNKSLMLNHARSISKSLFVSHLKSQFKFMAARLAWITTSLDDIQGCS